VNEVNREKIVSELRGIPGLKGIVQCGDGLNLSESAVLLYHIPGERFCQELEQAVRRLEATGVPIAYCLREIEIVERAIADCLDGKIAVKHASGHPFGVVNSSYAAEIHYGRIIWEMPDCPVAALKQQLAAQGPYPEKLRQATIAYFMREAIVARKWPQLGYARRHPLRQWQLLPGSLFLGAGHPCVEPPVSLEREGRFEAREPVADHSKTIPRAREPSLPLFRR